MGAQQVRNDPATMPDVGRLLSAAGDRFMAAGMGEPGPDAARLAAEGMDLLVTALTRMGLRLAWAPAEVPEPEPAPSPSVEEWRAAADRAAERRARFPEGHGWPDDGGHRYTGVCPVDGLDHSAGTSL